jgi:1-acyl-sn-glycerol-3-phosphate acyltransferase
MSDAFYKVIRFLGRPAFWNNSVPTVLGATNMRRDGAFIVAATHSSPYDIPLLMRHVPRPLDFVSITEVFKDPFVAWLYGSMNAFPLERSRPDAPTVRIILDRLKRARVVAMFPEGGFRKGTDSVVYTHKINPGVGRIAQLSGAPVVPCVIVNSGVYSKFHSWLPMNGTRYGIAFGDPIFPARNEPGVIESKLVDALVSLHAELTRRMSTRLDKR